MVAVALAVVVVIVVEVNANAERGAAVVVRAGLSGATWSISGRDISAFAVESLVFRSLFVARLRPSVRRPHAAADFLVLKPCTVYTTVANSKSVCSEPQGRWASASSCSFQSTRTSSSMPSVPPNGPLENHIPRQ